VHQQPCCRLHDGSDTLVVTALGAASCNLCTPAMPRTEPAHPVGAPAREVARWKWLRGSASGMPGVQSHPPARLSDTARRSRHCTRYLGTCSTNGGRMKADGVIGKTGGIVEQSERAVCRAQRTNSLLTWFGVDELAVPTRGHLPPQLHAAAPGSGERPARRSSPSHVMRWSRRTILLCHFIDSCRRVIFISFRVRRSRFRRPETGVLLPPAQAGQTRLETIKFRVFFLFRPPDQQRDGLKK
jgi:hypothetical protein